MLMPCGTYRGHPVSERPTNYLLWWASQALLCARYPATALAILAELRTRLAEPGRAEADLQLENCDLI